MAERDFSVNQRIRKCRRYRNLSQTQVAESLGIKTSTYSQMERKGHITVETLIILSEKFCVNLNYLVYGTPEPPKLENTAITPMRYNFLEEVSSVELNHLKNILFQLPRNKRGLVYEYALKLLDKKYKNKTARKE